MPGREIRAVAIGLACQAALIAALAVILAVWP